MSVKIFLIVFFILILVSTILIIRFKLLTIKSVEVVAEISCASPDQLKDYSKLFLQNIILINSSKIRNEIKSKFLCVKDVQISRVFPNKVGIFVSGREPRALLLVLEDEQASQSANIENIATPSARAAGKSVEKFLVDSVGLIFSKEDNYLDIFHIYYYKQDIALGQVVEPILKSLKILEEVKSFGLDARMSEILDGLLLIHAQADEPKIIFKLDENLDVQLASLQLILNQAKIEEKELELIDLRFDKPVVKLAPKKN